MKNNNSPSKSSGEQVKEPGSSGVTRYFRSSWVAAIISIAAHGTLFLFIGGVVLFEGKRENFIFENFAFSDDATSPIEEMPDLLEEMDEMPIEPMEDPLATPMET
ncbi:MAG: hypothetical protein ACFCUX_08765, partial [Candidatus Methylacidiphilales bacterium]